MLSKQWIDHFFRKVLVRPIKKQINFITRHRFIIAVLVSILTFFLACAGLVITNAETVGPDDAHIVVLYQDGVEQTILTRSDTVGDLLNKLQINLGEFDLVEPGIDSFIDSDNFKIHIYTAQPTTVFYDDKKISKLSPYVDPKKVAEQFGIVLDKEDIVVEDFPGNVGESQILGRKLVVKRAANISIALYGSLIAKKTQSSSVSGVLREMNIRIADSDTISPSLGSPIKEGMSIFITKQGSEVQGVEEVIPFITETREDSGQNVGYSKTLQTGVDGKKLVFYEIDKTSGAKTKILETTVYNSINAIVVKGTKPIFANYTEEGIPARVFCGSPKQGNWKNINVANAAVGRSLAEERGWTGSEFDALLELFACESSWNENAGNPYSGAYGIPQAWPATKMASFGEDYMTNPLTQLRWGLNYIAVRYGTPSKALAFHYRTNYY